ncbi:MAG: prepilin-type N-terminal cleavage/methylation domain-containing protein [Arcobacter sp.]|nr:prepilin-type N-terminal cleavage/methylation domain-containing protein [Arcobacter sp.]
MKKGFSLLELIFAIVIIGIIASFAVPKYINTRDSALASTIKRDLVTVISSIQTYYLVNRKIEKISDAILLNNTNWLIEDNKITFNSSDSKCLDLTINETSIIITLEKNSTSVCKLLDEIGVKSQTIDLI